MKIKIDRLHYPSLRNDEFAVVYGQTLRICEKRDMGTLRLEKSYGELASHRAAIEGLTVYLRKNEKLSRAGQLDVERDHLLATLNRVTRGFEYANLPEINPHHEELSRLLDKHRTRTIAGDSRAGETERLQMLETEVNGSAAAQSALDAFGLRLVATRLFAANREYDALFHEYIEEKSSTPRVDVSSLRREVSKSLVQFLDAVQYSAYVYEDVDYTPLIAEIQTLNRYYMQQLKARAARRKSGAKSEEEPPIPPMPEA